jgi:heme o synthase
MKNTGSIALNRPGILIEYIKLMKPELTMLSVLTAVTGSFLAQQDSLQSFLPLHTLIGTALVGGSAGALNQYRERHYDALMKRTERRPLPSGRIRPLDALSFGIVLAAAGIVYIIFFSNFIAGILALLTVLSYLFVYTPLKMRTPFATVAGGVSGALPPLIGWAIVQGSVPLKAWSLFFILFFWQMPHFLALGWMYKKDYARAGYKLLSTNDPAGIITGRQVVIYCAALIPASVMPALVGIKGSLFFSGAMILAISFLMTGIWFFKERTQTAARRLFRASIFFLTFLIVLLILA